MNASFGKSLFSNYSNKVDIAAPGGDILPTATADSFLKKEYLYSATKDGVNTYGGFSGTSAASPVVAASAALLIAGERDFYEEKNAAVPAQVEERLKSTAKKLNTGYSLGAGCVDVAAALDIDVNAPLPQADIVSGSMITPGTELSLETANTDAVIYYTINGKTPTPQALEKTDTQIYEEEDKIELSSKGSVTVKALSVLYGKTSKVVSFTYKYAESLQSHIQITSKNGSNGVAVGKSLPLQAEIRPTYAQNQRVIWSSSDTSVATINATGVLKGLSEGTVSVSATAADGSGAQGTIEIDVKPPVTAVTIIDSFEVSIEEGMTYELSVYDPQTEIGRVSIQPHNAVQSLTYQSSNSKIATVDETGLVTAIKSGTATITVFAADGSGKKDTIRFKVVTPLKSISIYDQTGLDKVAAGQKFIPTVLLNDENNQPDNPKLNWSVTKGEEYAQIDSKTGVVTISKEIEEACTVTICAVSQSNPEIMDDYTFAVYPLTSQITIDIAECTIKRATPYYFQTYFEPTVLPDNTVGSYRYTSSNPSVVAIRETTGYFRTLKTGTSVLTMEAVDGSKKKASVKVTVSSLESVSIANDRPHVLYPGKSLTLQPVAVPSSEKLLTGVYNREWGVYKNNDYHEPENTWLKVLNGKVTAKAAVANLTPGTTQNVNFIYWPTKADYDAYYKGDDNAFYCQKKAPIELYPAGTEEIIVDGAPDQAMEIGQKIILFPTSLPEEACQKYYTYATSNAKVIKAYTNGTIMAVGNGTAKITVTAGDGSGKKKVFTVTVAQPVTKIDVIPKNNQSVLATGKSLQMNAAVNSDAGNKKVTWSLEGESAADYATINSKGVLKANQGIQMQQKITVVATALDGSGITGKAEITIAPAVSSLKLSKTKMILGTMDLEEYQKSDTLIVQAEPANAYTAGYAITSSKPAVAMATYQDGVVTVTSLKKGTSDIRVTAMDGSGKYAVCKVTVQEPVTRIEIQSKSGIYGLTNGKSLKMTATLNPGANTKTLTWMFTDPENMGQYAELDAQTGLLKAKAVSEKKIVSVYATATDPGKQISEAKDIVIYPESVASVKIEEPFTPQQEVKQTKLCLGGDIGSLMKQKSYRICTYDINGTSTDELCQNVIVKSSNPAIADADAYEYDGKQYIDVTAGRKPGTATITVTADDGSNQTAKIKVTVVEPIRNLNIKSTTNLYTAAYGTTLQLKATTTSNATSKKIVWSLDSEEDKNYVELSANGVLKPKKDLNQAYTVRVLVTAQDGSEVSAYKDIDLVAKADSIEITGPDTVLVNDNVILNISSVSKYETCSEYQITYTTGSAKVTMVNREGRSLRVLGIKKGTTKITVTALDGSGLKATYTVQVQAED